MTFNLTIKCDNAAFRDPDVEDENDPRHEQAAAAQVALILRDAAKHVEAGCVSRKLSDVNGNQVGKFYFD